LGFNITNLVLHIGTAVAFYLLMAELFKKEYFAFIASLLFSLHPIANETVNFHAGGRNTLLCAFFALLSMLFHARRKFFAAVACFALALFSKEFALLIPAVFLFYDLCLSDTKPPLKSYALYVVALVGYLTLRSYAVASPNFLEKLDFANLLLLTPKLVIDYLSHMVYPLHLHTMYEIAPAERVRETMPYILGIVCIIVAALFFRKKRELLLATGWFFLFLAPVSGILPTGLTAMADRYVYFSSMGFAMALAYLICQTPKKVAAVIVVPLCICYAGIDFQRNFYWKDQLSLFTQMVKDVPEQGVGYQNLGYLYYDKGDMDNAVKYLSIAYTKKSINSKMMIGSASIFWEAKQYDKAILALNIKMHFEPGDPLSYLMMSKIYGDKRDTAKEKLYHDKALQISPQVDEMIRQRLETLGQEIDELLEKHNLAGAERLLKEAQKIDPNSVSVLVNSGTLAAEKGDLPKSLRYLTKAMSLNPLYPPVHYNMSIVYQMMGNKADAEKEMIKFKETDAQAARKKNAPAEK
jgi:tetratricopeptide (TPR) repeat protein